MRLFSVRIAALACTLLSGCSHSDQPTAVTQVGGKEWPGSGYINFDRSRSGVVVFIHGVLGNSKSTWTNGSFYWPEQLRNDQDFQDLNVFVYSFPSPYRETTFTMDELVNDLLFKLKPVTSDHSFVALVGHSMGGLVARAALIRAALSENNDMRKVRLLYQFATPVEGADIANLVSALHLSRNPQFQSLVPTGIRKHSELDQLRSNWTAMREKARKHFDAEKHLLVLCAYEIQPTYNIAIVQPYSARSGCDGNAQAVNSDHINIVKPDSRGDKPYLLLADALRDIRPPKPAPLTVWKLIVTVESPRLDGLQVCLSQPTGRCVGVDNRGQAILTHSGSPNGDIVVELRRDGKLTGATRIVPPNSRDITITDAP